MQKKILIFITALVLFYPGQVLAEDTIANLTDKIRQLQEQIAQSKNTQQTLSSQIAAMDRQIQLTTLKISQAKQKVIQLEADIGGLSNKIVNLEASLDKITNLLLGRIVATYEKSKNNDDIQLLFSSVSFGDLISRYRYLQLIQSNDKKLLLQMQATKNNYQDQKTLLQDKQAQIEAAKKELEQQEISLNRQKRDKENLLEVTKNDEKRYQQLLREAQSQLVAFRSFVTRQGGATLLNNQTVCDDWGCYYNQRDSLWGTYSLGGTNLSMAEYGCLVNSVAMVASHYKKELKPTDIALDPSAFFRPNKDTAYLWKNITVKGINVVRESYTSIAKIDEELAAGRPVIVGLYPGQEHFIVIKSGSKGNYVMHDPFMEKGNDVPFTSKYKLSDITLVDVVRVN